MRRGAEPMPLAGEAYLWCGPCGWVELHSVIYSGHDRMSGHKGRCLNCKTLRKFDDLPGWA